MKKKILITWIFFHLAFIIIINSVSSYNSWNDFNNKKINTFPAAQINSLLATAPCKYYGTITGAETGYGFFGINVRSNGLLLGECNGEKLTPDFKSDEASLRFFTMANSITDDLIKSKNNDSLLVKSGTDLLPAYHDLLFKNIAVTLMRKHECSDTVAYLSYSLLNFPTLAEVRKGAPKKYELIKLLDMRFSLNKDEK